MQIREYKDKDDLEYIILLEEIDEFDIAISYAKAHDNVWYRGVTNASYRLLPKGYRNLEVITDQFDRYVDNSSYRSVRDGDKYLLPNFEDMLDTFKQVVEDNLDSSILKNEMDWLFIAQHYGLPTPLLDWTTDYKVAGWFATEKVQSDRGPFDEYDSEYLEMNGAESIEDINVDIRKFEFNESCAAIYVMNPVDINSNLLDFTSVDGPVDTDFNYDEIKGYIVNDKKTPYGPMALKGKDIDVRLKNQKGCFTIHGTNIWELDYYSLFREKLIKILIPHYLCKGIHDKLESEGYTREYIYNGFDPKEYAAKAIGISQEKNYARTIKKYRDDHKLP